MARKAQAPEPRMKPARDTGAGFCAEGLCAGRPARTEFSREHVLNSRSPVFFLLFTGARPRRRVPSGMHRGRNRRQHASSCALGTPLGACGLPPFSVVEAGRVPAAQCAISLLREHALRIIVRSIWKVSCVAYSAVRIGEGTIETAAWGSAPFTAAASPRNTSQNLWLDADCIRRQAIGAGMRPDRSLHASRALPR